MKLRVAQVPTAEKFRDKDVVIDQQNGTVTIDGVEFPYAIEHEGIRVEVDTNRRLVYIPAMVFAGDITIVPKRPTVTPKEVSQ